MKKLLTLLLSRQDDVHPAEPGRKWWYMRESTHDDVSRERGYLFVYPVVLDMVRKKINQMRSKHEAKKLDP